METAATWEECDVGFRGGRVAPTRAVHRSSHPLGPVPIAGDV